LADTLEELKSMCECGSKTIFNARIREDGTINPNPSSTVDIGGNDKYKSVCRKCFRVKSKVL
jgi:thymidine kinase